MNSNYTPIRLQVLQKNLGTFKKVENHETSDQIQHAANLLATCVGKMSILPAILEVVPPDGTPIPQMSHFTAYAQLSAWWKTYKRVGNTPTTWFSDKIQASDILVTPTGFVIEDKPVPVVIGVPDLDQKSIIPRIAADALIMYTSKAVDSKIVNDNVNADVASKTRFPCVILRSERIAIEEGLNFGDTMIARDAMMEKMKASNQGLALCAHIVNKVYSLPSLKEMGHPSEPVTKHYNKYCDSMGLRPVTSPLNIFKQSAIKLAIPSQPDTIWRLWKNSTGLRGGNGGRGKLSVGYYRGDLPAHIVKNIAIVNDVLMVMKGTGGIRVVEIDANPEIIKILLRNDVTVISPTYGSGICSPNSKRGIYSSSQVSYIRFIMPTLADVQVNLTASLPPAPEFPIPVHSKKGSKLFIAVRDYIRPEFPYQYPSSAPAEGICIRLSHELIGLKPISYIDLMKRFSAAVIYRNNFIFARHTFASQDNCRSYFTNVTYPRLKPETGILCFDEVLDLVATQDNYEYDSFLEPVESIRPVYSSQSTEALIAVLASWIEDDFYIQVLLTYSILNFTQVADAIFILQCIPNIDVGFLQVLQTFLADEWRLVHDYLKRKGHICSEETRTTLNNAYEEASRRASIQENLNNAPIVENLQEEIDVDTDLFAEVVDVTQTKRKD